MVERVLNRKGTLIALAIAVITSWFALRGSESFAALMAKNREIRRLEDENAKLRRENDYRMGRIQEFKSSTSEQQMEIRKQLKLAKPGETTFMLPNAPNDSDTAEPPGER